jgi:DNA-binding NarL/FixJ family response regulator
MELDRPVKEFCKKYGMGTKRQQQMIQCIADGLPVREIADLLGTTKISVDNTMRAFYKRSGLKGRNEVMSELYKMVLDELQDGPDKKLEEIRRILG